MSVDFKKFLGTKGDLEGVPPVSVAHEAWNASLRLLFSRIEDAVEQGLIPTNLKGYFRLKELINETLSNEEL